MFIAVATKNQTKLDAVTACFTKWYQQEEIDVVGYPVSSGVPETPYNDETYQGALQRCKGLKELVKADCYVGLESGLVTRSGLLYEETWAVIMAGSKTVSAYSSGILVSDRILLAMKDQALSHAEVMKMMDKELESSSGSNSIGNNTWHHYTGGKLDRVLGFEEALRNTIALL